MSNKRIETGLVGDPSDIIDRLAGPARTRTRIKTIVPLYDRLLVRPLDENGRTKGGLYVPEVAKQNKQWARGEVMAAGAGRVNMNGDVAPMLLKVGDLVLYPRAAGSAIPLGDEDDGAPFILIREPDVLGTIELEEVGVVFTADGEVS